MLYVMNYCSLLMLCTRSQIGPASQSHIIIHGSPEVATELYYSRASACLWLGGDFTHEFHAGIGGDKVISQARRTSTWPYYDVDWVLSREVPSHVVVRSRRSTSGLRDKAGGIIKCCVHLCIKLRGLHPWPWYQSILSSIRPARANKFASLHLGAYVCVCVWGGGGLIFHWLSLPGLCLC